MQVQIKPWGNSQGIRLPQSLLKEANIRTDDTLEVRLDGSSIILTKAFPHRSLRERAAAFGGELRLSDELERDDAVGSEVW